MSQSELLEWAEFLQEEPLMADRNELQMAGLMSVVVNMVSKSPYDYTDFMITAEKKERDKNEALQSQVLSIFGS